MTNMLDHIEQNFRNKRIPG